MTSSARQALGALNAALVAGTQPSAPPSDPVVLTSVLTADLATKANASDLLGVAQDTLTALNGISAGITFVAAYLTDLTGATDQTAQIKAAATAAGAGAYLVFPACTLKVASPDGVAAALVNTGQRWVGAGDQASGGTKFILTTAGGAVLQLKTSGAQATGFRFTTSASSSTAAAVIYSDGVENPRGQRLDGVSFVGFQDQIRVLSGEFWKLTNFDMYNATRYGVWIRNLYNSDSGDGVISAGTIYADNPIGDTAIRQESGGGLKITSTKILQFNKNFVLAVANGANTSILMIDGSNSFENPRSATSVQLGRIEGGTTGIYGHINVEAQLTGTIVVMPGVENVRIGTITRNTTYGVIIQGGDNINVTPGATFKGLDQAVVIQDPATNVKIGDFAASGCRVKVSDQRTAGAGRIALTDTRPISLPTPTSSSAYVPLYEIPLASYRGVRIGVQIEGTLSGVGAVNSVADVLAIHNGTTVTAPTAVSAQVDAGAAPVQIQYDTTTTTGALRIGARVPSTYSGNALTGSITVKVDGRISAFKSL